MVDFGAEVLLAFGFELVVEPAQDGGWGEEEGKERGAHCGGISGLIGRLGDRGIAGEAAVESLDFFNGFTELLYLLFTAPICHPNTCISWIETVKRHIHGG